MDEHLTGKKLVKSLQARGVVFGISNRKLNDVSGLLLAFLIYEAELLLVPEEKGFWITEEGVRFVGKEMLTWQILTKMAIR